MKKILFTVLSLLFLFSACASNSSKKFSWVPFNDAYKTAKKEKKHMILIFFHPQCGWCTKLEKDTLNKKSVQAAMAKNFIATRISTADTTSKYTFEGQEYTAQKFMDHFKLSGTPSLVFFDSEGKVAMVLPGYLPPRFYKDAMKFVLKKCYTKKVVFQHYIGDPELCQD